ncbi:Retrotransposon Gag-like protein 3 [Naganishia albida]|nr:Retrotransposon Gag-like protein 3 [Naganishia albida]
MDPRLDMKIAAPDAFSGGKGEDVDEFVEKCNRVFKSREAVFHNNEQKIIYTINLLKKKAYRWIAPHENKEPEDRPAWSHTWEAFSSHLRSQFTDIDKALVSRTELRELKQEKSVSDYSRQFHELAAYVDFPDEAPRFQFFYGLKIDIQLRLLSHDGTSAMPPCRSWLRRSPMSIA